MPPPLPPFWPQSILQGRGGGCLFSIRSSDPEWHFQRLGLESRGVGVDQFRASDQKWGRKWPKNGFWPHQGPSTTKPQPPSQGQVPSSQAAPSSCSVASSGLSYASVAKGLSGQADGKDKDKALMTKKADSLAHILETLSETDPLREEFQHQLDQLRNDLRDPSNQARLGNCQTTKSRSQGAEMSGSPEAGRRGFAFCPRRESGIRLRVESRTGCSHPRPTTAGTPPEGVRLDLILRGHGRVTRYATAVWPASSGGARRSRGSRHRGETTQGRPLRCPDQTSHKEGHPCKPRSCQQASGQCSIHPKAHAIPRGRKGEGGGQERWGWVVPGGNSGGFSLRGCPPTRLSGPGSRANRKHPLGHPLPPPPRVETPKCTMFPPRFPLPGRNASFALPDSSGCIVCCCSGPCGASSPVRPKTSECKRRASQYPTSA